MHALTAERQRQRCLTVWRYKRNSVCCWSHLSARARRGRTSESVSVKAVSARGLLDPLSSLLRFCPLNIAPDCLRTSPFCLLSTQASSASVSSTLATNSHVSPKSGHPFHLTNYHLFRPFPFSSTTASTTLLLRGRAVRGEADRARGRRLGRSVGRFKLRSVEDRMGAVAGGELELVVACLGKTSSTL